VIRVVVLLAVAIAIAAPAVAHAQWTRVLQLPATDIFSVWTNGDTIAAGAESTAFVSTNAGTSWIPTAKVASGATAIQAVRVHKGRLYAGTYGQGVFVSQDLGATWQNFSQGLVGGVANSQLFIKELLLRGDTLYAATAGAGPWIRNLAVAGSWARYGNAFEPNQASNMEAIATSPTRLLAAAGANGTVFFRDPGQADWTLSWLNNVGAVPGLGAQSAIWTGQSWIVGSNAGLFRSATGQSPWTFIDVDFEPLFLVTFARRAGVVFAQFGTGSGTVFQYSLDHGATWHALDDLPFVFTYEIATLGNTLYAARFDGLWRRSVESVSAPTIPPGAVLEFAIAGEHPVRDEARFRFVLPHAGRVRIELFDAAGRRVAGRVDEALSAGPHTIRWSSTRLAPGVYVARLDAAGRAESIRFVRLR
jgi:hypothetical protein